jgi:hypothetical protein
MKATTTTATMATTTKAGTHAGRKVTSERQDRGTARCRLGG